MKNDDTRTVGAYRPANYSPPLVSAAPRIECIFCGKPTPRSTDRPFCLKHSAYAARVREQLELLEAS